MKFTVTPDALDEQSRQMRQQHDALAPADPGTPVSRGVPAVIGGLEIAHHVLVATLRDACDSLSGIAKNLSGAASTYRDNDAALAAATNVTSP